jgi:hypothetical protein
MSDIAPLLKALISLPPGYPGSFQAQTNSPLYPPTDLFFEYKDDFLRNGDPVATTLHPRGWKYTGDGNGNVTSIDGAGGILQIATTGTSNDEQYLSLDGFTADGNDFFNITANSGRPLWYYTRVKASSIVTMSAFVGLAANSANAANFLTDTTGVIADVGFVGFNILAGSPTAWNYTHKKAGQTVNTQAAVATNDATAYVNLGIYFDGGVTLRTYINGVLNATQYDVSAATFPSGVALVPIFGVKTHAAAARNLAVDVVHIIQGR